MAWKGIDKRKFPRAAYSARVSLHKGRRSESIQTQTENIGAGGIAVVLAKPLEIFSEIDLDLTMEEGQPPLQCVGQIVWVVRRSYSDRTKPPEYDTGIEFLNLKPEQAQSIEAAITAILSSPNFKPAP